jgi:2,5-diketo-D-gluconate reductase B
MDFRTSRRSEAAAGACALPPPHHRKDTIMESITTQGVAIPRLGFGTFRMPGGDAQPVVESAIALGYRHIDTAAMYENEAAVGAAITASGVNRNELSVTTKAWHDQLAPDALLRAFDASLGKLRLDHVDL